MSDSAVVRLSPAEVSFMDKVYRDYATDLYKYLRVYIERTLDEDIYDCVHDTFIIAMRKVKELVCVKNIGGWIYRTAILNARNFIRKRRLELSRIIYRELDENDIADYVSAELAAIENVDPGVEELYDKMHDFFMTMSDDEKVIYNCMARRMSYRDIAAALGVNLNRVYYLCRKFEKRMRKYILK